MPRNTGISAGITVGLILAGSVDALARQAPAPAVAVVGFATDSASSLSPKVTDAMTDKLAVDLVESGRFRVLDREWLGPGDVSVARMPLAQVRDAASAAGVAYLIVGHVSRFTGRPKYGTPGPIALRPFGRPFARYGTAPPRQVSKRVDYLRVSIEIVDAKTGLVLTETSSTCPVPPKSAPRVTPVMLLPVTPVAAAVAAIAGSRRDASSLDPGIARAVMMAGQVIARWNPPAAINR
jgi:hypothetical protein